MTANHFGLFVSSSKGDDANPGTRESPFHSIERARDEIRSRKRLGSFGSVTVWIGEGTYPILNTLQFDERDSGQGENPVIYRNLPNERPYFIGGARLSGWEPYTDRIYKLHLGMQTSISALYENGDRSILARSPKSGYHVVAGKGSLDKHLSFSFHPNDIPETITSKNLQVFIWPGEGEWNWFTETKEVASMDWEQASLTFKHPSPWGIDHGSRYRIQGELALLTEPGEFYWDAELGDLYYYPRKFPIEDQTIVAPFVKRLIEIKGSSPQNPVSNLVFQGLSLEATNFSPEYRMPEANCERKEALEAIVYMENSEHIAISDCLIRNSGYSGVMLYGACQHIRIERNLIEHTGHNGVYLIGLAPGEGDYKSPQDSYVNKNNRIYNNIIRHGGELIGHSSGIQLYQSGDNEITHNRIYSMPRYGISLKGLRWGVMEDSYYGTKVNWENHWDFTHSRNNLIAYNDISDVMKDSQDGGMFEAWGPGRGNQVIGNRFHHSGIYFSFGFCIYLDDASDDFLVKNNVIHDLYSSGNGVLWFVIFSKGIGNRIENNLLIQNDAKAAVGTQEMAGEANKNITVLRNISYNSGEQLYHFVNWDDSRFSEADCNLFYNNGKPITVTGIYGDDKYGHKPISWAEWRKVLNGQYDSNSKNSDPLLVDPRNGDFRLQEKSPAFTLGFEAIDLKQIGLTDDFPFPEK